MGRLLYAVIQDGDAGLLGISTEIVKTAEQAMELADRANRNAAAVGVPVHHRVFALCEMGASGPSCRCPVVDPAETGEPGDTTG